jgi:hypothetical protein
MGYPNSEHIKKFVQGKTVVDISTDERNTITLTFADGERLTMYHHTGRVSDCIIATPWQANGEVKQSTTIMAEA